MGSLCIDISKMSFSDAQFFLSAELVDVNVMSFEFISDDIDINFVNLISKLKGWYSAYFIQKYADNFLYVMFVTKVSPIAFVKRISKFCGQKGGIKYV